MNRIKYNNTRNKRNYNRNEISDNVKKILLNRITSTVEIHKHKFKVIQYENDLELLEKHAKFITPNFNGVNCLLCFFTINGKYHSIAVNKKSIDNMKSNGHQNINKIKMFPLYIRLRKNVYNGTIFDGTLLYNNGQVNKKVFVINDVYQICGDDVSNQSINNKMVAVRSFVKNFMINDDITNSVKLIVNKVYNLDEAGDLINNYVPASKWKNSIKGVVFLPEKSGYKMIYHYNNCTGARRGESYQNAVELVNPESHHVIEHINKHVKIKESVETDFNIEGSLLHYGDDYDAIFRVKQVDVDVYSLYLGKKVDDNKRKMYKYSTAYLPTIESSAMVRESIKDIKSHLHMGCKFTNGRWIPIKVISQNKPDRWEDVVKTESTL